ncbi:MAG: geranylgeranylglyceryl/heptaprenylglyceryl phosphate synthase [Methanomassiliicoccales archaeon]|nr:MAG: geranylgeranylglyceryl/heptaprenylglyceryl phosphate synthase [Methanomassiliicoccales archaeon]
MKVFQYILDKVEKEKMHMTLLDPDKQQPSEAGKMALMAVEAGSDAIMIGGSTGVEQGNLDETVREIKKSVDVPTILFPAGAHTISKYADAIYFMSILNSENVKNIVGEQRKASLVIKKMGIQTIPMGYLIVEPGMTVGRVGEASLIPRESPRIAVEYALAGQYLGMGLIYLEAGSGAPAPVPKEMIRSVKAEIDIPLVVGGGIRSGSDARQVAEAGADVVVTGTIVEMDKSLSVLHDIVESIKSVGKMQ